MSQLSAQSITKLCRTERPMLTPFVGEKMVHNGMSYGLSAASYDVRIARDTMLYPHGDGLGDDCVLANTLENFDMPANVVGYVYDKSSWAREFVSCFNTLIDPGFKGNLTLELVNHSNKVVKIKAGDPICQIVFVWLDEATERPYVGKYQNQAAAPQPFIYDGG